ncbi:MAG: hypothetical protein KDE55_00040 [Novosphingobium sp.]|nr:hypothetical protein [Novosphingobium sp.]
MDNSTVRADSARSNEVVCFPLDLETERHLRNFTGPARDRLDEIVVRLAGMSALLFAVRNNAEMSPSFRNDALMAIETMVDDCVTIAQLRPLATKGA